MAEAWPETLPRCLNAGYSAGLPDGRLAYKPDTGPAIMRKRSSSAVSPLSGEMRMTRAQVAALKAFVETALLDGSLPFTFIDPVSGEEVLVRFPDGSLPGIQHVGGGKFRVSISLEILP
jgi:hypothetical protein